MNYFTIRNESLSVTVRDFAAELQSVRSVHGTEFLWQGNPAYWCDRSLTLFPYVARLTDGTYRLDGKTYRMDIHGLAPYSTFRPAEQRADSLSLELCSDETTMARYPRRFLFRIIYALRENRLEVCYTVENRDDRPMYFGLGGHPGINVPLTPKLKFEDYRLRFNDPCSPVRIGFTPYCFLSGSDTLFPLQNGTTLPLRHDLFDNDAIVLSGAAKSVTLEADSGPSVTLEYPDMDYLGLWHMPKTDAPFLCLEPWCSLPSRKGIVEALETQPSLLKLDGGETGRYFWSLTVRE